MRMYSRSSCQWLVPGGGCAIKQDTREINGTRYSEINARNHKSLSDDTFLPISRDALIKLMKENIGSSISKQ